MRVGLNNVITVSVYRLMKGQEFQYYGFTIGGSGLPPAIMGGPQIVVTEQIANATRKYVMEHGMASPKYYVTTDAGPYWGKTGMRTDFVSSYVIQTLYKLLNEPEKQTA